MKLIAVSFRLNADTVAKLADLAKVYNGNKTAALIAAINEAHEKHVARKERAQA